MNSSVDGGSALRTFLKLLTQFGKPIFNISRKKDKIFVRFPVINDWKIGLLVSTHQKQTLLCGALTSEITTIHSKSNRMKSEWNSNTSLLSAHSMPWDEQKRSWYVMLSGWNPSWYWSWYQQYSQNVRLECFRRCFLRLWVSFNSNTAVWWGVAGNQKQQLWFEYSPYLHPPPSDNTPPWSILPLYFTSTPFDTIHISIVFYCNTHTAPSRWGLQKAPWKIRPTQGKGWRPPALLNPEIWISDFHQL